MSSTQFLPTVLFYKAFAMIMPHKSKASWCLRRSFPSLPCVCFAYRWASVPNLATQFFALTDFLFLIIYGTGLPPAADPGRDAYFATTVNLPSPPESIQATLPGKFFASALSPVKLLFFSNDDRKGGANIYPSASSYSLCPLLPFLWFQYKFIFSCNSRLLPFR